MGKNSLARRPRPDRSWRRDLAPGGAAWAYETSPIFTREELARAWRVVKDVEAEWGRRSLAAQLARAAHAAVRRESRRVTAAIDRQLADLEGPRS